VAKKIIQSRQRWRDLFLDFIGHLTIISKEIDAGRKVPLLDVMYEAQHYFLNQICDGLDHGIHSFTCLKARQLGISTISLAIDLFWLSVHEKIQGALVVDEEGNKEKFRVLLEQYIEGLPRGLRVGIARHNRNLLVLNNGSSLDYLVAGQKRGKATLGQSRALNFLHATEVSSYGSEEGFASLTAALAHKHPHRLYIYESTAKGLNLFYDRWNDAKEDDLTQRTFFCGWWLKEDYAFPRGSKEFQRWWNAKLDDGEIALCREVWDRYQYKITAEQLAWHRYYRTVKISDSDLMNQNFPWTEDQAFIMTGKSFFPLRRVTADIREIDDAKVPLQAYRYHMGENFLATEIEQVDRTKDADLRVWEEPVGDAVYVMGIDPAYGRNDNKDRHAIEVFRCFADRCVQVAEYATDIPETYQTAWVMAHLAGCYGRSASDCRIWINLEIGGPGGAIMNELRHLRQLLDAGVLAPTANAEIGMDNIFGGARWYLYHRPDSMGAGYVYNWKTTADNKLMIMNQLRDNYTVRALQVRSIPLLQEMERVVQNGGEIAAEGRAKDDRVFATALANRAWVDWVRPAMITSNESYDRVMERLKLQESQPQATFVGSIIRDFFVSQQEARFEQEDTRAWDLDQPWGIGEVEEDYE